MLFGLFGDVDLLMTIFSCAYNLYDWHRSSVNVVYCFDLITHRLKNGLYFSQESGSIDLSVKTVGDGDDVNV